MKTNKTRKIIFTSVISLLMITFIGCTNSNAIGTKGNGKVITKDRVLETFTSIEASGAHNIFLTQNDTQSFKIETDENLEPLIITEVKNGVLKIYNKENIKNPTKLNIYINVKELNLIDVSGANDIVMQNTFKTTNFLIKCSGACDMKIKIETSNLKINSSGAGDLDIQGSTNDVIYDISGAVEIKAYELICKKAKIDMSGAGSLRINVSESISGSASGACSIFYKGNPTLNNLSKSGVASFTSVK